MSEKIPLINPDGDFVKVVSTDKEKSGRNINVLKRIFKDNTKYESFEAISLNTQDGHYLFGESDQVARLYGLEGWDFEYCDFELAKWDELKKEYMKKVAYRLLADLVSVRDMFG